MFEEMAGTDKHVSSPKARDLHLPVSRVKTIMKSSPDVDAVGQDPLFLVTKVTELFIVDLAKSAYRRSQAKTLEYKHLANIVQSDDTLDFLREIMPCKITVRQFKDLMAKKAARGDESETDESESSGEEEEEEESEEEEENETEENEPTLNGSLKK